MLLEIDEFQNLAGMEEVMDHHQGQMVQQFRLDVVGIQMLKIQRNQVINRTMGCYVKGMTLEVVLVVERV